VGVSLRAMEPRDVDGGLRLCRSAGWNQTAADWRFLLRENPGRFVVAEREGAIVGTGGASVYGRRLAWVCMILVDPDERGRGIGTRVMQEVLERVADCEAVGLDATPKGRPVYERLGFRATAALTRWSGVGRASGAAHRVEPLLAADLAAVAGRDADAFGVSRAGVLRFCLEAAPQLALHLGRGHALARPGHHSTQIGPIVAEDAGTAAALAGASLDAARGAPVVLDAPDDLAWRGVLAGLGLAPQRPFTRMFRGGAAPPGELARQFAIAGPELG
jgi:GNAT superfamily N-acetyltransferase